MIVPQELVRAHARTLRIVSVTQTDLVAVAAVPVGDLPAAELDGARHVLVVDPVADWVTAELDALAISVPDPHAPESTHCSTPIPKTLECGAEVVFVCTQPDGHADQHEARGTGEDVLAHMPGVE